MPKRKMEPLLSSIETLIENAKKSLNKPYKLSTITTKLEELQKLQLQAEKLLCSDEYSKEERSIKLGIFIQLKNKYTDVLEQHKRQGLYTEDEGEEQTTYQNTTHTQQTTNMDTKELLEYMKIIPVFTGDRRNLESFVTTIEIIDETLIDTKRQSFFNFIYKTRIDKRIQQRIQQLGNPKNLKETIAYLNTICKPKRTVNTILNQLSGLTQGEHSITKFGEYIENLTTELTDIQTLNSEPQYRAHTASLNYTIALNTFTNGLSDRNIRQTLDARGVKTFQEAVLLAEELRVKNIARNRNYQRRTNTTNGNQQQNNHNNRRNENYKDPNYGRQKNYNNDNRRYQNNNNHGNYNNNRYGQPSTSNRINCINKDEQTQENYKEPEIVESSYSPEGQEE